MRTQVLLAAALACALASSARAAGFTPGEVLALDADTFVATVKKHHFVAVEFYAPVGVVSRGAQHAFSFTPARLAIYKEHLTLGGAARDECTHTRPAGSDHAYRDLATDACIHSRQQWCGLCVHSEVRARRF